MGSDPSDYSPLAIFRCLERSHAEFVGKPLVAGGGAEAVRERWLYTEAPFGVLAHEEAVDPRFIYANRTAQRWFERDWRDLVGRPSRESAGSEEQSDRNRLLADVAAQGWSDGYRGIRVASSGRRFWIEDVLLWNLVDDDGLRCGQAALLRSFRNIDE